MSFHVVIPARLASTRLPRKVLRKIAGRPMIEHVCRAAQSSWATSVTVATDTEEIASVARAAGAEAVITAADHSCGSDRIAEAASIAGWLDGAIVVNVQADEPMMSPALINQVGRVLLDDTEAAIATAATPIDNQPDFLDPNIVKVVAAAGRALYFSRAPIPGQREQGSEAVTTLAQRHLGIYAYRVAALRAFAAAPPSVLERQEALEQLRAYDLGLPIALVDAVAQPGPGVDTAADLALVEQQMRACDDGQL